MPAGCAPLSTPSSLTRTERPRLPTLSDEATKTERLPALTGKKSGELILIDKGDYGEQLDLLAEAIGAVARLNNRQGARNSYDRCVKAIFETGKVPATCPINAGAGRP
jgi:hypothetical protein